MKYKIKYQMLMTDFDQLSIDDIRACLHTQSTVTYDLPPAELSDDQRQAAVLIPFIRIADNWHILYIRRTRYPGSQHSGQVAFVGGKRNPQDIDLEATALREAEEEIGLSASNVNLLGSINHRYAVSEYQVTPFVAEIAWPYPLKPDKVEVDRAFTLPLSWLVQRCNYRVEQRSPAHPGYPRSVVYYDVYDGEQLWGATARMTLSLIELLKRS